MERPIYTVHKNLSGATLVFSRYKEKRRLKRLTYLLSTL